MRDDRQSAVYFCVAFGTPDHDRCNAMQRENWDVEAFEWRINDTEYLWKHDIPRLFKLQREAFHHYKNPIVRFAALAIVFLARRRDLYVFYGYQNTSFLFLAALLKVFGRRTVLLYDSKFDDYRRSIWTDVVKGVFLLPYRRILAASSRACAYLEYLGARCDGIYYCAIDTSRIGAIALANRTRFDDRNFVCVARFHPKKNLSFLLRAYKQYASTVARPRRLVLCGYGELERSLRAEVASCRLLSELVTIRVGLSAEEIASTLSEALCLLLPSKEEQFGIVVTEALAAGVPVLISNNCGSTDLVKNSVNGFVLEPDNLTGWSTAMSAISRTVKEWEALSAAALKVAKLADVGEFCRLIEQCSTD